MIGGETVEVGFPAKGDPDPFNSTSEAFVYEEVGNVLVAPGATEDLGEDRPDGVSVAYTLYFPKTFLGELRGCAVKVRGEEDPYMVVGNPKRYPDDLTPGDWNMQCEIGRTDG